MSTTVERRRPGRAGLLILLIVLAVGLAVADQVTKYLAEANLTPGVVTPILGNVLSLQLIYNPGAAFSLATGMTWVFTIVAVVVVVVILRAARKLGSLGWSIALGMLLGGSLGNLYDRLLRDPGFARGHVVDFINYNGWFVGNVADIAIVVAAVVIAVLAIRGIEIDGTRAGGTAADAGPADAPGDGAPEQPEEDVDVAAWVTQSPGADARAGSTVPGEAVPEGAVPEGAVPGDATSAAAVPDGATPTGAVAGGATSGGASVVGEPEGRAPGGASSGPAAEDADGSARSGRHA